MDGNTTQESSAVSPPIGPVPFDAGFAIFTVLAFGIAIVTTLVSWHATRRFSRKYFQATSDTGRCSWTVLPSLLIMIGCAMMTAGGTRTALAARSKAFSVIGPILYLIGMIVFFVGRFIYIEARTADEKWATKASIVNQRLCRYLFSTACLLIPGIILLALFCRLEAIYLDEYEYFGVMRVTGWEVEESGWENDELDETNIEFLGKPKVAFGEQWGCPLAPTTWCEGLVYDPECVHRDRQVAEKCVRDKYNLYKQPSSAQYSQDDDFPVLSDLDRSKAPDSDPDWPYYALFHGDCETCSIVSQSEVEVKARLLNRVMRTGTVFSVGGILLYLLFFLVWVAHPAVSRRGKAILTATESPENNDLELAAMDDISVESGFRNERDDGSQGSVRLS